MYTVTEIAHQSGVSADTVRHYVNIGLLHPERNPRNGYKLFDKADAHTIRFVKQAQSLGFTLAEIQEIVGHSRQHESPCPQVREIIQRRIDENRARLKALNDLQQRMETALQMWQSMPDGVPDGNSICHLIESIYVTEQVED